MTAWRTKNLEMDGIVHATKVWHIPDPSRRDEYEDYEAFTERRTLHCDGYLLGEQPWPATWEGTGEDVTCIACLSSAS